MSHQRERLMAGVAKAMAEHGYYALSVAHVIAEAGTSRSTFYEHFGNKQEAVLAAHELLCERFVGVLTGACAGEEEWPLKVKAAIGATVDFVVAEPAQGQLLTVDALAADVEVAQRMLDVSDRLAAMLSAGRQYVPRGVELPELTEKALVGAVSAIVASRLMNGEPEMLLALEPQLVELILLPYVGAEEARRVAETAA